MTDNRYVLLLEVELINGREREGTVKTDNTLFADNSGYASGRTPANILSFNRVDLKKKRNLKPEIKYTVLKCCKGTLLHLY